MHNLKLSAYNSNVQRIRKKKTKKFKKSIDILKLSAYNRSIQRIRKKNKKKFKNMQHFKLSAYNKVQATGKQINQFSIQQ